ncbi:mucin-5AC isoform X2 [Betta splendens]|uniref:Mucin-5AC isoform X2 n=1 Tax=Betta splendens TaxID=158456 RepID=A0A6P7N1P3_BETSP|nr:mucin-5AC isoform X2 [Betta splendens]
MSQDWKCSSTSVCYFLLSQQINHWLFPTIAVVEISAWTKNRQDSSAWFCPTGTLQFAPGSWTSPWGGRCASGWRSRAGAPASGCAVSGPGRTMTWSWTRVGRLCSPAATETRRPSRGPAPGAPPCSWTTEDQRNSSEGSTTHRPGRGLVSWSPTETVFTRTAPVSQDVVSGIEGVRGRLYEGWGRSRGPRPVSGLSWEGQGSLQPTTPLRGLALAERTDGETLPLPEEATNNGADTSGSARPTDSPVSAREATSSSVHTHHTLSTDTSDTWSAETKSGTELAQTQVASTAAAASNSDAALAPGKQRHAHAAATASSSSLPALSSSPPPPPPSPPPPPPPTTWGGAALLITHGGAVGEGTRPHSWTGANTNTFSSDLTSAVTSDPVTSDPVTSHSDPLQHDSGSARAGAAAAASASPWTSSAHAAAGPTATAASLHPNTNGADSSESATSGAVSQTVAAESSDRPGDAPEFRTPTSSTQSGANLRSTASFTRSSFTETSTDTHTTTQRHVIYTLRPAASSPPGVATVTDETSGSAASSSALGPGASTAADLQSSSTSVPSSTSMSTDSHPLHTHSASTPSVPPPHTHTHYETRPVPAEPSTAQHTSSHAPHRPQSPSSTHEPHNFSAAARVPPLAHTTKKPEEGGDVWRRLPSNTTTHSPTAGPPTSNPLLSSTSSQPPKYYIVPDQPAAIKVETVELLLQIVLEDSGSAYAAGWEEDAAAWVRPYLQKAPGFSRLLGVWGGGHAVQNLVEFRTSGALQWLGRTGPASLLERTGLAQAVREATSLRTSRITNITVGGQQGEVCDWLLRCPPGYACASQPDRTNYSCSSLCHLDHCHHHGICTHHPGQLPVCRCLVGESFWYMGQRCDVRMTRARLVGACLAILLIIVTVIGVLAVVAVRRYRAVLIQAKVDQTRSSYRRFNHFDELSGRFWLRSWAGSADSMDNPAFTRSDELLHLRALDRPCCYHDDTLSLASTCPSHGTRVNTIYPHSSQYAWRGSELSVGDGDGVLDSGKASDLSVCSWPVEPIQWTPFPLLQRLSSHRTPPVRAPRPRSYCEGMELVDLEKSWTA